MGDEIRETIDNRVETSTRIRFESRGFKVHPVEAKLTPLFWWPTKTDIGLIPISREQLSCLISNVSRNIIVNEMPPNFLTSKEIPIIYISFFIYIFDFPNTYGSSVKKNNG